MRWERVISARLVIGNQTRCANGGSAHTRAGLCALYWAPGLLLCFLRKENIGTADGRFPDVGDGSSVKSI